MKKNRVNVVTMGCSKNLVDSEVLMGQLEKGGLDVVNDSNARGFDAVVINTCGFIQDAKQESIDLILDYVEAKKRGDIGKLYVMGCLSQRYRGELATEIPEVDRYFGKFDLKNMVEELKVTYSPEYTCERKITTPPHYAYLKISEGCNRSCSFCAIPQMTGRHRSKPIDVLVKEARLLAKKGVKEVLLIAQDLSYYGIDIYGETRLAELIGLISEIGGIEWIRLHYLYPAKFPYEILQVMRENPKVCKYLDIPLQHIATPVLRNMLRHVTREDTEKLVKRMKEEVPGVALRTTMLVGFPGETEGDFEEMKDFIRNAKFDKLGVFSYSEEEGTYAAEKFEDNLPEEVKQARADEIMEIQQQVSAELNQQKIGKVLKVIVDREEGGFFVGRTEFDSPEVDGEVFITSGKKLRGGEIVQVRVTGAEDYDLFGVSD